MEASATILGISPGTRTMGLAILRDGTLIEWQVKTFKGSWSKEKREYILRAIEKICGYYGVTAVAIKKVAPHRSSPQLNALTEHIINRAQKNGLRIATYSLPELVALSGKKHRNIHHALADCALDAYPELRRAYLKERNNKREYYAKMFEAILCAHLYYMRKKAAA